MSDEDFDAEFYLQQLAGSPELQAFSKELADRAQATIDVIYRDLYIDGNSSSNSKPKS